MTTRELALHASSPCAMCLTVAVLIWPAALVWNVGERLLDTLGVKAPG